MRNPVINALTNETHPCQGLCDLMTIKEKKGRYAGLKIGYLGDLWNVSNSLMMGAAMMGMDFYAALPNESYGPNAEQLAKAREWAQLSGSKIVHTADLEEIATGADVIYGNTWHSMATENREQRLVDFKEATAAQVGRVVDQEIDAAEGLQGRVKKAVDIGCAPDVGRNGQGSCPERTQRRRRTFGVRR